jgi:hypothetical protein
MYRNADYIADSIFPLVNGLNYQTKVLKYQRHPWFALGEDLFRSENAVAKRGDLKVTTQNLDPREVARGGVVSDELLFASQQPGNLPIQPAQDTILLISDTIDRFREKLVADTIFSATWSDGTSGGSLPSAGAAGWATGDSTANSFIKDIETAKDTVRKATGVLPNCMFMDYSTMKTLKYSAQGTIGGLIDRIKYTQIGITDADLMGKVVGIDNVIIGKAIYTPEKETVTGEMNTPVDIWNQDNLGHCMVYYRPGAAGMKQVCPGYQYRVAYDGQTWRRLTSYREEWAHHTVYEVSEWIDIPIVSTFSGYLFKRTIA